MTPSEELRAAAAAERLEWGGAQNARQWGKASAIHLAVAALLDVAANDWDDDTAARFGEHNMRWYPALVVARAVNGTTGVAT